jgi:hypothetical protein
MEHRRDCRAGHCGLAARSVALAGFGLDSLIEIGTSTVVIWELSDTSPERQRRGLQLIGFAFTALAVYLLAQSTVVLAAGYHPRHSVLGIIWTAVTAAVMFARASGKARTGRALDNPVLRTEGGAAGTLGGVEGRRTAGAAPRGRRAAAEEPQAEAELGRSGGTRRPGQAAPRAGANEPAGDTRHSAGLASAAGPLAVDLSSQGRPTAS